MTWGFVAVGAGTLIGGYMASQAQQDAAAGADAATQAANQAAIAEQRRQFDAIQALIKPFTDAGIEALGGQKDLLGLNGSASEASAIDAIQKSPTFLALGKQGQDAILQNASATGGLRSGDTVAALAQFQPALLQQFLQQRFANLGGISQLGQASAAGGVAATQNNANQVSQLFQQSGASTAGLALATGQSQAGLASGVGGALNTLGMLKLLKGF